MSIGYGNPKIVTDNLIFAVDAANGKSVGDGVYWYNIPDNIGTGVFKNGSPTVEIVGGAKAYRFTSTSQYFESSVLTVQPSEKLTMEAWIYPENEVSSGDRGTIIRMWGGSAAYMSWNKSNQKLSNYWYQRNSEGYHESGAAMQRYQWHHICSVWTGSQLNQFTDGVKSVVSNITGDSPTGTSVEIGMESTGRQFSGGIAVIRIYNSALSDDEVYQNFNASRVRFGV